MAGQSLDTTSLEPVLLGFLTVTCVRNYYKSRNDSERELNHQSPQQHEEQLPNPGNLLHHTEQPAGASAGY